MAIIETTCRFEELDHGVLAFTLRPDLNEVPWTDIERIGSGIVDRIASRDRPRVIVDLSELNHMGSALVALVVRIWKTATEKGGRMVVVNRSDLVGEVLRISGLASKWKIVPNRGEAVAALGSDGRTVAEGRRSRSAVVATVLAAVLLLASGLAIADALSHGTIADRLTVPTTAWPAVGLAAAALVAAAVGIVRGDAGVKLAAVSLATLSVVAAAAAALVAVRPAVLIHGPAVPHPGPINPGPINAAPINPAPVNPLPTVPPPDTVPPELPPRPLPAETR